MGGAAKEPALRLLLSRRLVEGSCLTLAHRDVQGYLGLAQLGLTSFSGELKEGLLFGFNGAVVVGAWDGDVLPLIAPVPTLERQGAKCTYCDQSSGEESRPCASCGGTGWERRYDHSPAFAVAATFSLLLEMAMGFGEESEQEVITWPRQLLEVHTTVDTSGFHACSLGGTYSRLLVGWLERLALNESELAEVSSAMQASYRKMLPFLGSLEWSNEFRTNLYEGGRFHISCPGDACGLDPCDEPVSGRGYKFAPHNVDTPAQQLTLLAGLAALSDRAVAEGVGQ